MNALTLSAPAKLNLFLHIVGRRADGYHELQSVFQLLDYGDELQFTRRSDGLITLRCPGTQVFANVPENENLVVKAARLLRETVAEGPLPGAHIVLHKRLPTGGGLGGGSSDAASTLLALNHLWGLQLSIDRLADLAQQLGADVPVFVRGQSAWAEGIGERLTPLELPPRWYLVVTPNCHISTQMVFSHPQLTRDTPAITMAAFFAGPTRNDCETLVRQLFEPVDSALIFLQKFGEARMSGSGASVFLSFASEGEALAVKQQLHSGWQSFVARGVNRSPARIQLDAL